jgi:Gp5 C-terminal repeat (3 copies)
MGVFSAQTKVGRAVADPKSDRVLPPSGALTFSAIATPAALAGTVGVDCKLVHGDRWQQITGSVTEFVSGSVLTNILQNHTLNVTGNRTKQVTGNHTETICGVCNESMLGPHMQTNVGPRNNTLVAPRTESHSATSQHTQPANFIRVIQQKVHWETFTYKSGMVKLDVFATAIGLFGILKMDATPIKLEISGISLKNREILVKIQKVTQDIKIAGAKMLVTGALIGLLRFGTPFKPNALPAPTPITPFD